MSGKVRCEKDLNAVFATGASRYGTLSLAYEAFASRARRHLRARRVSGPSKHGATALSPDLYLTMACAAGVNGAWECFELHYHRRLKGLAMARGLNEAEAEELAGCLPGSLAQPPRKGGFRTRIGSYDGSCTLFTWLGVILLRRVADRARARIKRCHIPAAVADTLAGSMVSASANCEHEETALALDTALSAAWSTLSEREAALLRFKYLGRLSQAEIASLMGIGPPRVCRLLQRALTKLRREVQRSFPAFDATQCSACDELRQKACLSLAQLLADVPDSRT